MEHFKVYSYDFVHFVYMECCVRSEWKSRSIESHIIYIYRNCRLDLIVIWYHWIAGGFAIQQTIPLRSKSMFEIMNEILTGRDTVIFKICFHRRVIDNSKLIFFLFRFRIYFHSFRTLNCTGKPFSH